LLTRNAPFGGKRDPEVHADTSAGLAILRVCRQTNLEAAEILYGFNFVIPNASMPYVFNSRGEPDATEQIRTKCHLAELAMRVPPKFRHHVMYLTIRATPLPRMRLPILTPFRSYLQYLFPKLRIADFSFDVDMTIDCLDDPLVLG
jgi:hypothetical protein